MPLVYPLAVAVMTTVFVSFVIEFANAFTLMVALCCPSGIVTVAGRTMRESLLVRLTVSAPVGDVFRLMVIVASSSLPSERLAMLVETRSAGESSSSTVILCCATPFNSPLALHEQEEI